MTDKKNLIEGKTGLWEVVIGLEVHAQVMSQSKLFSGASTKFGAEPNTQVAFLDAGMPGMLPMINHFCVDQGIKTGLGLGSHISKVSTFDRKNYFYPDLPTGYQITQFHHPIAVGGHIDIDLDEETTKRIRIHHMHMEQDAGKSTHDLSPNKSYIDLNRAGIALMEIVSEPDMRSKLEAELFVKKLRSILRYLQTCDGNMEQGSMRADVNVSLHRPDEPFGTRAEIKNMNSFRFMNQAIDYEVNRQIEILESGGKVHQETRLFDSVKGETRGLRSKEDANDYRYFPCPDLLPLVLSEKRIEDIHDTMIELPDAKCQRLVAEFGVTRYDASVLVSEKEKADWYEKAVASSKAKDKKQAAKLLANWLISEVFGAMNKDSVTLETMTVTPEALAEMVDLILDDTISGKIAKQVFAKMWETGKSPAALVDELGLRQVTDVSAISAIIEGILEKNGPNVEAYRAGKEQLFGFFVGQVMKETQGKANPGVVNKLLREKL